MLYLLGWSFVLVLLALWSLVAWALHGATAWALSNAGALSGAAGGLGGIALPEGLAPWLPAEWVQAWTALVAGAGPMLDGLLQALPSLSGGLGVAAWLLWGLGCLLLLVLGAGAHGLVALARRRGGGALAAAQVPSSSASATACDSVNPVPSTRSRSSRAAPSA